MSATVRLVFLVATLIVLVATGFWLFNRNQVSQAASVLPPPVVKATPVPSPSPSPTATPTFHHAITTPAFQPVAAPPAAPFLGSVKTDPNLRVSFYYEGDAGPDPNDVFYNEQPWVMNQQGDHYLVLPRAIDAHARYGPTTYSIFRSEESHSYQGIPFYIRGSSTGLSLVYVALKINDPALVADLRVEMGIDYNAEDDGDHLDRARPPQGLLEQWLVPDVVCACGPGIYLNKIGESALRVARREGDVMWYRLEKPVFLGHLPLDYCGKAEKTASSTATHKPDSQDDEDGLEEDYSGYCPSIKNLAAGHLRLHILYKPAGNTGVLQIQALNFVLRDGRGNYLQPEIGLNFDHYYKAFLGDSNCLKAEEPASCASQQ